MAVGVFEIDAATVSAMVDVHVFAIEGAAAVGDTLRLYAAKDVVEVLFRDVEGVVVVVELLPVVVVEGEGVVDLHRGEVAVGAFVGEAEDFGEELGGADFVTRGHDGVVQCDGHGSPPGVDVFCKSSISEGWDIVYVVLVPGRGFGVGVKWWSLGVFSQSSTGS